MPSNPADPERAHLRSSRARLDDQQDTPSRRSSLVYLGLGSNLGDRWSILSTAVQELALRHLLRGMTLSPVYETDAISQEPQPPYLNAVVRGESSLSAAALLTACLCLEADLGRVRPAGRMKAARVIDVDLLLYGAEIITSPELTLPHPALLQRPFVLIPLADVAAPGLVHPVTGRPLGLAQPSPHVRPWRVRLVPPKDGG